MELLLLRLGLLHCQPSVVVGVRLVKALALAELVVEGEELEQLGELLAILQQVTAAAQTFKVRRKATL